MEKKRRYVVMMMIMFGVSVLSAFSYALFEDKDNNPLANDA
jgi:hypothetical protein